MRTGSTLKSSVSDEGVIETTGRTPRPSQPRQWLARRGAWLLGGAFLVLSMVQVGMVPDRLGSMLPRLTFVAGRIWPPNISGPGSVARATLESLQIAVVGTAFGIILSLALAFVTARNITPVPFLGYLIKGLAGLVRVIPALVWALLFIVAVGLGPTPGILALSVNSIGMLVKVYSETIEEIPMGPIEALRAAGATRTQIVFQSVLPSVLRSFIAWSVFRLDINVRYSAILGIVGAGGIGWELVVASQSGRYDDALGVTLVIFVMVMAAEVASQWLRNRVEGGATIPAITDQA